ncbi:MULTISPECIES: DUF3046 domain-containing protein [Gordonia]|uniref:DUF3046 domain-containing protein n=2 Tax=Gordonia TaxID=2053 RepID=L7LL85_9ACTN|nr:MULTISPECIES: DUF3046 domain-containing protein [Gordonia]AUH69227.1 DUF3046 domain-containing protein [Gordonia sp. YC-JH1]KJR05169.1 hypothetical protein UG54_17320 [Gordonia sihwensis]KXT57803.1 hypothetical protein Y710_06480 [Gordonia sp. QH-12]MBY4569753.1 hypothetical protein [Gordonia sihwensis]WFN94477.1 DUF3046 domain-containing protein [Gordonia sihwensis]
MRLTEFAELTEAEFGRKRADGLLTDLVLMELGGRTGREAIEQGVDPKLVWRALCREFDVPPERW